MRCKTIILALISITICTGCDLFNSSGGKEVVQLNSELTNELVGEDVLQVNGRIFIFGYTEFRKSQHGDFYLAEINKKGKMLWEKTYGTDQIERGYAIIQTSDDNLLMVGGTGNDNMLYAVKVDYDGKEQWANTYTFDLDTYGFGENYGRTVTEVTGGYIVGGQGIISGQTSGYGVAGLTKIAPDGHKVWSKAVTNKIRASYISSVQSFDNGSSFIASGGMGESDLILFDSKNADTLQTFSTPLGNTYSNVSQLGNYPIVLRDYTVLSVIDLSRGLTEIISFDTSNDRLGSISNINNYLDQALLTGSSDGNSETSDVFAAKIDSSLQKVWTFVYHSDMDQHPVGSFPLPNGDTGIVANQSDGYWNHIVLIKVNHKGKLKTF